MGCSSIRSHSRPSCIPITPKIQHDDSTRARPSLASLRARMEEHERTKETSEFVLLKAKTAPTLDITANAMYTRRRSVRLEGN